ncbi:MAG: 4-hydroxythreonine-4-phosphate dehydrogenase PdxA [Candidatus Omnitrophica bacterium]|nr:4-hydroxythreonine-4-phosphate dehydrogenase PdxA [Candidatus Omnitrophota bacterium]
MHTSRLGKKLVVITSGDPAGIGPEIILKSLAGFSPSKKIRQSPGASRIFTPLVIGDYGVFQRIAKISKIDISSIKPRRPGNFGIKKGFINFIDLKNIPRNKIFFGKTSKIYGKAAMEYVSCGALIARSFKGASLVTAPINKASIAKAGYNFAGHTEFLSHITKSKKVTMMLVGGPLRVSLVSRHVAIKNVAKSVTKTEIIKTLQNTHYALKKFFKISCPKIGIAGLNPHAGDGGVLGREEKTVIAPAVTYVKKKIKNSKFIGPLPADTLFYKAYRGKLDAVCCMYHDQGLIPLKMVAFEKGVNFTIGLPFIRTSPDHGTGFDIAGRNTANPSSMIEAIKLAVGSC